MAKPMKPLKILFGLILLIVIVVVVGLFIVVSRIDQIAKTSIERAGTYALGVNTTVGGVSVGLLSGQFGMDGFNVANPTGFDTPHFMNLGTGGVAVTYGSLQKDTVELPYLRLADLDMNLQKKDGKSNYQEILTNLKKFESQGGGESQPKSDAGASKKFVIREVEIKDINVHVDMVGIGGELTKVDVPIETIKLTNVGSGGKPVRLADLSGVIIKAVMAALLKKQADIGALAEDLQGQLAQLEGLGEMGIGMATEIGGQMTEVIEGVGEDAQKALDEVEKKLDDAIKDATGLIPGKKKD